MSFVVFPISESDHKRALVKPAFASKIVHGSGRCKSVVRFLANAFWRHPRRMLSRRETSLRLPAKIRRERLNPSGCAFLPNNHFFLDMLTIHRGRFRFMLLINRSSYETTQERSPARYAQSDGS